MNTTTSIGDMARALDESSEIDVSFLPVGTTSRQPLGHFKVPCEVRSESDLPSRLYLGNLVSDSFSSTDSGWSVRYEDADPDTYVNLEYKSPRGPLIARFVWAGIDGMSTYTSGSDWKSLIQHMSLGFPEAWERKAKENIEADYNARLFRRSKNSPCITGFPDGAFETLVFPVPSYRLHKLVNCLDAMDKDPDIAAVVGVYVVMTQSRIDYLLGRCPDVGDTPVALAQQSRNTVGLPCRGLPQAQTIENNLPILALNRWVYITHVRCFFRDLERVVSHCHRQGFIGVSGSARAPSDCPDGMEWTALVLPGGLEVQDITLEYFDKERTRRVTYGRLLPPGCLPSIAAMRNISRTEALRRLSAAEAWAHAEPEVVWPTDNDTTH